MKKTTIRKSIWTVGAAVWTMGAALVFGQDTGDRLTVPFRDASKPRTVNIEVFNGSITVRGGSGNDAIIEANGRASRNHRPSSVPPGMHQITSSSSGLDISEDNNVINIRAGVMHSADVVVQVPAQTSLKVRSVNGGKIVIEGVSGEIDAQNMNGSVTMTNVSGSVLANSMNGRVTVTLDRVTPNKTMSFSSMNGTIDVTLPADIKANLKLKSDNGDIWSDFDVKLTGSQPPQVDDQRSHGGRYRIRLDKTMYGTINGGGPEMQFVTFNGNILIHKK
jgi:DUF4097 and DUF4098 domain-containing protein YvlB